MGTNINVYIIKAGDWNLLPGGIKSFVNDFFEKKKMFGEEYYICLGEDYKAPYLCVNGDEWKKYERGLSEEERDDCGVFSWFDNHPGIVFNYVWG